MPPIRAAHFISSFWFEILPVIHLTMAKADLDYPALEKVFVPYTKAMVKSLKNDEVFIPDEELQHIYLDMLRVAGRTNLKKKVEKFWK